MTVSSNEGMEIWQKNSTYKICAYHYGASEDSCLLQYGAKRKAQSNHS